MLRIISLNLNGIRSAVNKGVLKWLGKQGASVVCLQELKAQAKDILPAVHNPDDLLGYFHFADRPGYSGVGLYCSKKPDRVIYGLGIPEFDREGRYI
ncbi:MAG: exodeoxyribonuclease III, partial [Burkholderiales bacterium]|nr:exodeoxyribonuclease III [Burkholderiales bacterium]